MRNGVPGRGRAGAGRVHRQEAGQYQNANDEGTGRTEHGFLHASAVRSEIAMELVEY
jgi:hypothetical protein